MALKFRGLTPDEIEVRVDRITEKGVALLLYKNARIDMALLDEVIGEEYWQRDHKKVKENMYAGVGLYNKELKEWVWKWDCGTESFTEKEKGEASDSFKRACACWGIGRELYSAPDVFVYCETKKNDKGRLEPVPKYAFDGAYVSHISYKETANRREIDQLAIMDKKGTVIWTNMGKPKNSIDPKYDKKPRDPNSKITSDELTALKKRITAMKYTEKVICEAYGLKQLSDMSISELNTCKDRLNEIEDQKKKAVIK